MAFTSNRQIIVFIILSVCCGCTSQDQTNRSFFNGKDLTGWSASNGSYWSVHDSTVVGRLQQDLEHNQFLWSGVKVSDFYLSVDVKMDPSTTNAGIQFRSSKVNESGQARGYQADIGYSDGKVVWGTLYHEEGRGLLDGSEQAAKVIKEGEWNHYEILAVGSRIWIAINGTIGAAVNDPGGETSGYIALQIHSGPPQTIHYRLKQLVHNPPVSLAGLNAKQLEQLLRSPLTPPEGETILNVRRNTLIAFAGGTNIANMQSNGHLEALLMAAFPSKHLRFRNLGWEGDTVFEQFRDVGFGSWTKNFDSLNVGLVFVQFGQMEALHGDSGLSAFLHNFRNLLKGIERKDRTIVLMSPIPFEPFQLDSSKIAPRKNPLAGIPMERYLNSIALLAQNNGYIYLDLYHPVLYSNHPPLSYDGIHLNKAGQKYIAAVIIKALRLDIEYSNEMEALRQAIVQKNELWFNYWRPGNWAFLHGDRSGVQFSRHWQNYEERIFPEEMKQFEPLIVAAENNIQRQAQDLSPAK